MNYYNEHDSFASEWLRQLMFAGEMPWGWVDSKYNAKVSGAA